MARIKAGKTTRKRHKKVIKQAKGYFGRKGTNYKIAKQAVMKSGVYAYFGRKRRKRASMLSSLKIKSTILPKVSSSPCTRPMVRFTLNFL